ncbi:MAG: DeoR/GlpR transcriptional regulator [Firmicutes bacterium]|nr:DeoR/GlpR transcriptional regulator [Bacillota bacterium]
MLTEERQQMILNLLKNKEIVKINELVKITKASESTIRRDLNYLESINELKRVHGGARLLKGRFNEPSYSEKQVQNIKEKTLIGKYAASLIEEGDCIYIDAGTSTIQMIDYIDKKDIVIVTNGLKNIDKISEKNIEGYILGGKVKKKTKALVGSEALKNLEKYRFDKCFMGINGIHLEYGFTTPDSEEAILKQRAIELSKNAYVLADESKFGEITFVNVSDIKKATIITNSEPENYKKYKNKTTIKVVT